MNDENQGFVSGYAAIIGKPNVGKSTLLNTLLAAKVSAVTHKPQTTRKKIIAIYSDDESQIIFIDTPGIFEPNYELQKIMVRVAMHTMGEAEVILYMIDTQQPELDPYVLKSLKSLGKPAILIINKIDLVNKNILLPMIDEARDAFPFKEIIPTSALKETNTDAIIPAIRSYLPEGPPLFPEDTLSSLPERFFVADAIREQIFLQYGKEIPYSTAVYIEEFREADNQKKDYIRAVILVERDSQKKILIGKKGDAIKKLGIAARKSIELFLDRPIFLELFVKTKKKWRENVAILRSIGYLS
jgi:GTP-binding protein Era